MTTYQITMDNLLEIIKQKQEQAQDDINNNRWFDKYEMHELIGQRDACTDLIELIESKMGEE